MAEGSRCGNIVADRRDQAVPVRGELYPAVVVDSAGHECAAALERFHQPFALQQLDRLPHRDPGDAELVLQFLERGDLLADRPVAVADAPAQDRGNLQVSRYAAVGNRSPRPAFLLGSPWSVAVPSCCAAVSHPAAFCSLLFFCCEAARRCSGGWTDMLRGHVVWSYYK